jgi:hypothetical protein
VSSADLKAQCPHCQTLINYPAKFAGRVAVCTSCRNKLQFPSAPPPSPPPPPPRGDANPFSGIERDGAPGGDSFAAPSRRVVRRSWTRWRVRRYFSNQQGPPVAPVLLGLLGVCAGLFTFNVIAFIVAGVSLTLAVGLWIVRFLTTASDLEADELIRKDRMLLREAALRRLRDVLPRQINSVTGTVLPGWGEPVVFVGPALIESPSDPITQQIRRAGDGRFRAARSNLMAVVLGTYQLVTYRITIDHRNGHVYQDSLNEFFYQDVVSSSGTTASLPYAVGLDALLGDAPAVAALVRSFWMLRWLFTFLARGARSEVMVMKFRLTTSGAVYEEVVVGVEDVVDASDAQGALGRKDSPQEIAIRNALREVKSLTRREDG